MQARMAFTFRFPYFDEFDSKAYPGHLRAIHWLNKDQSVAVDRYFLHTLYQYVELLAILFSQTNM